MGDIQSTGGISDVGKVLTSAVKNKVNPGSAEKKEVNIASGSKELNDKVQEFFNEASSDGKVLTKEEFLNYFKKNTDEATYASAEKMLENAFNYYNVDSDTNGLDQHEFSLMLSFGDECTVGGNSDTKLTSDEAAAALSFPTEEKDSMFKSFIKQTFKTLAKKGDDYFSKQSWGFE